MHTRGFLEHSKVGNSSSCSPLAAVGLLLTVHRLLLLLVAAVGLLRVATIRGLLLLIATVGLLLVPSVLLHGLLLLLITTVGLLLAVHRLLLLVTAIRLLLVATVLLHGLLDGSVATETAEAASNATKATKATEAANATDGTRLHKAGQTHARFELTTESARVQSVLQGVAAEAKVGKLHVGGLRPLSVVLEATLGLELTIDFDLAGDLGLASDLAVSIDLKLVVDI